jgi:triphosphoribosyl-dephospho-CoA synthase
MIAPLTAFDRALKERGLNPGTSADLTVATLFAAKLIALQRAE